MKPRKKKSHPFRDWINETGAPVVAEILGLNESTVRHWRSGLCYPRVEQMRTIKKLTNGKIGYDQIIDGRLK